MITNKTENKINLDEVSSFLVSLGYTVVSISQPWRYVSAILQKDDQKFIFKLSSDSVLNMMLNNEKAWYDRFSDVQFTTVNVPKVFKSGSFKENLAYIIVEFVDGRELAKESEKINSVRISENLKDIVTFLRELTEIPLINFFPKDKLELSQNVGKSLYSAAENWMKESEEDSTPILDFMEGKKRSLSISYMHGDLAPWHFMKNKKNQLFVIDPEHGSTFGLAMYDAAHFFHKLYTVDVTLALEFISELRKGFNLSQEMQDQFEFVLAARAAGGIWEAKVKGWSKQERHKELLNRLLNKSIF